jgi:DNA-directed RNA polymerase sigma subunit (sigma70/sigma32)
MKPDDKPSKPQPTYTVPDSVIAAELGVSRQRVAQISEAAMTKLRKALEAKGIKFLSDIV